MLGTLLQSCRELAVSWFSVDRIRIAPTTGRLLQLQVGDRIVLRDQLYRVAERRVDSDPDGHAIVYRLEQSDEVCELRVFRNSEFGGACGELEMEKGIRPVFDTDVAVLKPKRSFA